MGGLDGLSRREFILLGGGVASYATFAGLGLMLPRRAHAVAGIDDLALGGLVLLVATLGGYAFSRSVANVSLDALGYGFSDFVRDSNNQAAAVTQAIADANNLGVELNRSNAENAAQSIAAGTGYFAEVMSEAATSGRVALDNFISGAGELPGVLRNLVGSFVETKLNASDSALLPGSTLTGEYVNGGVPFSLDTLNGLFYVDNMAEMTSSNDAAWCMVYRMFYNSIPENVYYQVVYGTGRVNITKITDKTFEISAVDGLLHRSSYQINLGVQTTPYNDTKSSLSYQTTSSQSTYRYTFSANMVSGGSLPLVDRAADAPGVIGPGYDSLPLANDLVIDPSTDEVVSAGSLPLPSGIPDVFGDYVGTLNDILAGVLPGQISLPVSVAEPVVVGTAEGVQSMSISDAIAGETSLAAAISPPVGPYPPYDPVEPPVDVPEGPWTPAVSLPFELIWPFNMIYSFVELFEQLGGS